MKTMIMYRYQEGHCDIYITDIGSGNPHGTGVSHSNYLVRRWIESNGLKSLLTVSTDGEAHFKLPDGRVLTKNPVMNLVPEVPLIPVIPLNEWTRCAVVSEGAAVPTLSIRLWTSTPSGIKTHPRCTPCHLSCCCEVLFLHFLFLLVTLCSIVARSSTKSFQLKCNLSESTKSEIDNDCQV